MFQNEYILNVDLKKKQTAIVPMFVQHDTASLVFRIFDNGKPFDLTDYVKAEVTTLRKDGQAVIGNAVFETTARGQQQIRYDYVGNEMAVHGFSQTSLTIFSEDRQVSIQPFKVHIIADIRDAIGASQEYSVITGLIVDVEVATANAIAAAKRADDWVFLKEHDITKDYKKNNVVTFSGSTYIAITKNTGKYPVGDSADLYWRLVARKGADGNGVVVLHKETFDGVAGQTVFTLANHYDQLQNRIHLVVGGVLQYSPEDFMETTSNKVTLREPLGSNMSVTAVYFGEAPAIVNDMQLQMNEMVNIVQELDLTTLSNTLIKTRADGDYAKAQGDIAVTKTTLAITATTNANTATALANDAVISVNQAKAQTITATNNAITAKNNAGLATIDAINATSAAAIATTNANTATANAITQTDRAKLTADNNLNILLQPVANFAALSTTYPSRVFGSKAQTIDNGKIYRWDGTTWKYIEEMNSNILTDLQVTMNTVFDIIYSPATVVLTLNPSTTTKEYGDPTLSVVLTGVVTRKTQDINKVEFYRGATLLSANNTPNVNGGTFTYTENTSVVDTAVFKLKAYDARGSAETTKTISYVYPFYIGSLTALNPTEAQIKALTKLVKTKSNTAQAFTTTNGRFAIAYPQSYGALFSILDQNSFETIGSYTSSVVNITGLNGIVVPYNVYVLSTLTTQTNFTNTFKF